MVPRSPPLYPHRKPSTDGGIAIQDLTLTTPRGEQTVCRGLTLALAPGQSLLIVGPSGVGKTSLMRAMAGAGKAEGEMEGRGSCQSRKLSWQSPPLATPLPSPSRPVEHGVRHHRRPRRHVFPAPAALHAAWQPP